MHFINIPTLLYFDYNLNLNTYKYTKLRIRLNTHQLFLVVVFVFEAFYYIMFLNLRQVVLFFPIFPMNIEFGDYSFANKSSLIEKI